MESKITRIACALALAGLAGAAQAQMKTDGMWRGVAGAAAAFSSGNSSSSTLGLNVDMARATESDKISLGGALAYGKAKVDGVNKTTTDKWNGYGQYDWNLSRQLFLFGKLGFEGDKLAKLDLRSTVAGGVGYKLIDTKPLAFSLFGGAAYSTDKYSVAQTVGGETDTRFSRSSLLLGEESAHELSGTTTFKQRLELYPGLSGDKAVLAKFNAGLGVAMSSTMSLNVGVTDTYNSKPPAGLKKNDLGVLVGVNFKLGS